MRQHHSVLLIAAPELAEEIAYGLYRTLPRALKKHLSDDADWIVETVVDSLTGAAVTVDEIFQKADSFRSDQSWDYIVCLTDLPIFHGENVVAVDINESIGISLISIPAFGWRPILKRIRKAVIYTFQEMHNNALSYEEIAEERMEQSYQVLVSELIRKRFPISPVRKLRLWMNETGDLHTRFLVKPRIIGKLRLLSGMTLANNPFKMMSSLTSVIAIAFTTGAFGMIFTTMWKLSHLFSTWRLNAVTLVAIVGMVIWVITAHVLWEPLSTSPNKKISKLYNVTTALTLLISISFYYIVVFLLFLITSLVLIPPDFLGEILNLNHTAHLVNYLRIAWFAASISTVAGAIGAGLENEELVRDSTYGYRQKRRYQEVHFDDESK